MCLTVNSVPQRFCISPALRAHQSFLQVSVSSKNNLFPINDGVKQCTTTRSKADESTSTSQFIFYSKWDLALFQLSSGCWCITDTNACSHLLLRTVWIYYQPMQCFWKLKLPGKTHMYRKKKRAAHMQDPRQEWNQDTFNMDWQPFICCFK